MISPSNQRIEQVAARRGEIELKARKLAREIHTHPAVRSGFGGETVIENRLLAMAAFAIGIATGQERKAAEILAAAEQEPEGDKAT